MQRSSILFLVLCALGGAAALYEDQAGTYDWYQQHVGLVSNAVFHPSKPRICVTTEQDVVGCLNLRDGSIAWRKLLSGGSVRVGSVSTLSPHAIITTAGGFLRYFDLEGNLKWQRALQPTSSLSVLLHVANQGASAGDNIILVQGARMQVGYS